MNIKPNLAANASYAVQEAISNGDLIRLDYCELCNYNPLSDDIISKKPKIIGHHWLGYRKENWLDVWWVCHRCNNLLRNCHDGTILKETARSFVNYCNYNMEWTLEHIKSEILSHRISRRSDSERLQILIRLVEIAEEAEAKE